MPLNFRSIVCVFEAIGTKAELFYPRFLGLCMFYDLLLRARSSNPFFKGFVAKQIRLVLHEDCRVAEPCVELVSSHLYSMDVSIVE